MGHTRQRKHVHKWRGVEDEQKVVKFHSFRKWCKAIKRQGWKVLIRHPHHYFVAFGLSGAMWCLHHYQIEPHATAWLYALLENISTLEEE